MTTAPRSDADILRRVAHLVLVRCLSAQEFLASIERTGDLYDRDPPEAVRRVAAVVRFRFPGLCPIELAELLEAEAVKAELRGG